MKSLKNFGMALFYMAACAILSLSSVIGMLLLLFGVAVKSLAYLMILKSEEARCEWKNLDDFISYCNED